MMLAWELRRGGGDDGGLVADGSFSAALLADECVATGGALIAASHSVQLVPLVRTNARVLLDKQQNISEESSRTLTFSIPSSALALAHPTTATINGSRNAAPVVEPQQLLQCTLKLVGAAPTPPVLEEHDSTWFDVKLRRAGEWRARGNDAFKESKLARAVRAYRKALQWLACPSECAYDREEAAAIAPIALACHSNLATSYWKLGRFDACIAQATLALQHDPASVKALFRRSQALAEVKAFDDAVRDLERAHQLEPDNKLVRSALDRAQAALSRHTSKQRQAFAQVFRHPHTQRT